ncbi:MAG: hypothetical protein R2911_21865 [Caldilineaceae bacterium]
MHVDTNHISKIARTWLLGGLALLLVLLMLPRTSLAQADAVRATVVRGELDKGYSKHYLALEPTRRDAIITVTLDMEPQDARRVANKVNLLLLDADDLRRVQAGDKPEDLAFATGNPTIVERNAPPELIFHKTASFKASGRGVYTIVVYSRAPIPTSYTLTAENAEIVDESGQVEAAN